MALKGENNTRSFSHTLTGTQGSCNDKTGTQVEPPGTAQAPRTGGAFSAGFAPGLKRAEIVPSDQCLAPRGAAARCRTCLNPFEANNTRAFCVRNKRLSHEWCAREAAALRAGISAEWARSADVQFSSVGVNFGRTALAAGASQKAATINSVAKLLLTGTRASQPLLESVILKYDVEKHRRGARHAAARDRPAVQQLNEHGYVMFDHSWGLQAAFGTGFEQGVHTALTNHTRTEVYGGVRKYVALHAAFAPPAPGLATLEQLAVPRMMALAIAYLGSDAVYSGYTVLRLPGHNLKLSEYVSGNWHHDRCGRRVKCFVFLKKVTSHSHPPKIAIGSHRTVFYSYDDFHESRYTDEYVRREYPVQDLLGSRGEGFCFDTNSIHSGTLVGSRTR